MPRRWGPTQAPGSAVPHFQLSEPLEIEITRRYIPFIKFGGLKFLYAAHIKDLLAIVRWMENSRVRVAGIQVLQLMPRTGPGATGKMLDAMHAGPDPIWALGEIPTTAGRRWLD